MFTPETANDLERERAIGERIGRAWGCTLHKMPGPYPIDWYAERNRDVVGWVELKGCHYLSTRYGHAVVSLRKLEVMLGHSATVPAIFVFAFTDGLWAINARCIDPSCKWVLSRKNHRREQDTEPVINVPLSDMKRIPETPTAL